MVTGKRWRCLLFSKRMATTQTVCSYCTAFVRIVTSFRRNFKYKILIYKKGDVARLLMSTLLVFKYGIINMVL